MTQRPYYRQNRLKQLRAFCQAAQTGSISKAAERVELSQPSVSLQIQALERELGVRLFERRGPRIRLTPDGESLYELAHPLVERLDGLQDAFAARTERMEGGRLDIAAGESTILYILPEVVKRFSALYPGVHLKLHNVTGRDGLQMLRADEVDFAVGSMLDIPDDVRYDPIYTYDPVLITPLGHPLARQSEVSIQDISPYGLVLPPRHLTTWRMVTMAFQHHNVPYHVALEAGGWEVIKKYVEMGLGISIVTDICLTGQERLARRPLSKYFAKRTYGVVRRRGRFQSAHAKRFVEIMQPGFFQAEGAIDETPSA